MMIGKRKSHITPPKISKSLCRWTTTVDHVAVKHLMQWGPPKNVPNDLGIFTFGQGTSAPLRPFPSLATLVCLPFIWFSVVTDKHLMINKNHKLMSRKLIYAASPSLEVTYICTHVYTFIYFLFLQLNGISWKRVQRIFITQPKDLSSW